MFRKRDWIGVAGILMLIAGATLFLRDGAGILPLWTAWLLGPLLWYGGFLTTTLWFLTRIFATQKRVEEKKVLEVEGKRKASNFLEHDSELPTQAVRAKAALHCAGFIVLALLASASTGYARAEDASALFETKCAMCHGPNADGKTAMGTKLNIRDFHSSEVQKQTDAELTAAISKGRNKMPAYEGKLTPEQIGQLTAYVREVGKKN